MTVTSMGARVPPRTPSVVVGVGGGLLRTRVLDRAVAEARHRDRTVRIVHAHEPEAAADTADTAGTAGTAGTADTDDAGERAERYLHRTAPDLEVRRTCAEEEPAAALAAACGPATVLVVGDRRRRLGSDAGRTTEGLVAIAPCPVLVVPEYRAPSPAGTPQRAVVVVGIDDAPGAAEVLLRALRVAEMHGEAVEVVRAVGEVEYGADGIARRPEDGNEAAPVEALVAAARAQVPGVPVEVVVAEDRAARLLLARAAGADLVVVGHRGRTAGELVGVGSTTLSLLLSAPCPVLVLGPAITTGHTAPRGE
ncbi:universal stress protein [Actinomycetospora cinnamomea]|uniref:Nucleotide-binding universal stress UspA family protein n=1 Tax=Actinomycetospora cinnamomea TaxID=663609 RepID=A0A2U1F273_9PSEU|nr:universal stress protein [Actinomycetospora cinnamomea]PVZ06283.1 nucleotide-binding universal stress UspA family protein [Actinomycetospora cinnamomea]